MNFIFGRWKFPLEISSENSFLDIRLALHPASIENPYFSQYLHWNDKLFEIIYQVSNEIWYHSLLTLYFWIWFVGRVFYLFFLPFYSHSSTVALNYFKIHFRHLSVFFTSLKSNTYLKIIPCLWVINSKSPFTFWPESNLWSGFVAPMGHLDGESFAQQ